MPLRAVVHRRRARGSSPAIDLTSLRVFDPIMAPSNAAQRLPSPEALVGEFRRLGPFGPVYKVLSVRVGEDGDVRLGALVVESGESIERRYELVLRDPTEE